MMFIVIAVISCKETPKIHEDIYVCPMECPIDSSMILNKPGKCPVCLMDLITTSEFEKFKNDNSLDVLLKPTDETVVASIVMDTPIEKTIKIEYYATGEIRYDTRTLINIASRFDGRIEKLYVKSFYQPVKKGQKLFDIYSPEILTAQQNFIFLLKNDSFAFRLINAEKQKLILFGLTETQIETIKKTKKAEYAISVYSPCDGYVYEANKNTDLKKAQNNSMGMDGNSQVSNKSEVVSNAGSTAAFVQEGMYVSKGQTIFNVVNTEKLWAILKINTQDIAKVKLHQKVSMQIENNLDSTIYGTIDFIEPFYETKSVAMNVRINIDNNESKIKQGNWINAKIIGDSVTGFWINKKSTYDLGKNKIVWIKKENAFQAQKIVTGIIINDWVEIKDGLWEED